MACDAHEIDAVAIVPIRKVVPEMCAIYARRLSTGEHTHVFPDHFCISEARPTVLSRLGYELSIRAPTRRDEKGSTRCSIVKSDLGHAGRQRHGECGRLPVAPVLGIDAILTADVVRC